jgi:predicted nuclease with TOPRIM domain
MLGMISGLLNIGGLKTKLIIAVISVSLLAAGFFYVKSLRSDLHAAQVEQQRMLDVIKNQEAALAAIKNDVAKMNQVQSELFDKMNEIERAGDDLEKRFNESSSGKERDFGAISNDKPELVEKIVNRATRDALRCNEILTGSPLTSDEASGKVKNTICPGLLGGSK